jgi:hypothetical protein
MGKDKRWAEKRCPPYMAIYDIYHSPYCKHFTCTTCVEFCIDGNSENIVKNDAQKSRSKLSTKARAAGQGRMFVIREPNDAEIKDNPKLLVIGETISL